MSRIRISPALVVACIALLVAMAGTGVAAVNALPNGSVHTAALANSAVTSAKLHNGSVTASKLAKSAKVAPGPQGTAGPQGPAGPKGDAGPAGPAGTVSAWTGYCLWVVNGSHITVPMGDTFIYDGRDNSYGRADMSGVVNIPTDNSTLDVNCGANTDGAQEFGEITALKVGSLN